MLRMEEAVEEREVQPGPLSCGDKACGTCCIWNHLLIGQPVSMHHPRPRAIAVFFKAMLGLHAQAVANGKPADVKVATSLVDKPADVEVPS